MDPAGLPPYHLRDTRLIPGEVRFVDGWLLIRSRRHLFVASLPPRLTLWAQSNTCRRASLDPGLLWEGRGFLDAAVAHPPRELGHWRVDSMPAVAESPAVDELKYKLDGCRHILRQAGFPSLASLLAPLGVLGFALLEVTAREPGFADLIAQNAALAIAFAWLRPLAGSAPNRPASWKQRDLAVELGFSADSTGILARIDPAAITLEHLDVIRKLPFETRSGIQGLHQARSINSVTFTLLAEPDWRTSLTDRVIQEVGELPPKKADAFSWILGSVLKTLKQSNRPLPRIRSFADLTRLLSMAFPIAAHLGTDRTASEPRRHHFPAPFPGCEGIEPLDTVEAILEEGRVQRNCIDLAYVRRVWHGGAYLYKVTHPQRCSLMITRDRRRACGWAIRDLKAFGNQQPDAVTVEGVQDWFVAVTRGLPPGPLPKAGSPPPSERRVWDLGESNEPHEAS